MPLLNYLFDSDQFTITGYEDEDFSKLIDSYSLQVGPDLFDISLGGDVVSGLPKKENLDVDNVSIEDDKPVVTKTWKIGFIIDNTGLLPAPPQIAGASGKSIAGDIEMIRDLTFTPNEKSHRRPYVKAEWGDLKIQGASEGLSIKFSYFHNNVPLRAKLELSIKEFDDQNNPLFQSPDISRMPTVKEGDTLIRFCEEYYEEKNYYIKIAELNNLASFRKLRKGQTLEFPPIKK